MKIKTILRFSLHVVLGAVLIATVPWLIGTALAATGVAPPVPPPTPDAIATYLTAYGPIVGVLTLVYLVVGWALRKYANSHWLAQGKRLAWITAGLGVAGTALQAYVSGTPVSGVIATAALGILHIADAQVTPPPAPKQPQSGRVVPAVMTWIAVAGLMMLAVAAGGSGCGSTTKSAAKSAEQSLVNCTGQAIGATPGLDLDTLAAVARAVSDERAHCTVNGVLDWKCVETDAIGEGKVLGGCTIVELIASAVSGVGVGSGSTATARVAAAGVVPGPDPGRAALEDFRARVAGGATYHAASGNY